MIKHILITGGAGFIGSRLCAHLLAQGHVVTCFDSMITGRYSNIEHLLNHPRFVYLVGDTRLYDELIVAADGTFDQIYHLASPASPITFSHNPHHVLTSNVTGTMNVLRLGRQHGARVLFTSTSEVYGDPTVHPQPETYWGNVNPIGPRSCYDEGKRAGESLCMADAGDVCVVRLFNVYGPGMSPDDGRAVPAFIDSALRGNDITIYGTGQQTRSFVYVDDVVRALVALMNSPGLTGPYNIGLPKENSIAELANTIVMLTNSSSAVIFDTQRPDDPSRRCPDITKITNDIGWIPTVDLQTGLMHTITSMRD